MTLSLHNLLGANHNTESFLDNKWELPRGYEKHFLNTLVESDYRKEDSPEFVVNNSHKMRHILNQLTSFLLFFKISQDHNQSLMPIIDV